MLAQNQDLTSDVKGIPEHWKRFDEPPGMG